MRKIMTKEEFIALGLTEEQAKTCAEASRKELRNFVPQSKLDEVTAAKTKLEITVPQ